MGRKVKNLIARIEKQYEKKGYSHKRAKYIANATVYGKLGL